VQDQDDMMCLSRQAQQRLIQKSEKANPARSTFSDINGIWGSVTIYLQNIYQHPI